MQDCVAAHENTNRSVIPDIKPPEPLVPKPVQPILTSSQVSSRPSPNTVSRSGSASTEAAAVLKKLGISDREKRNLQLSSSDIRSLNRLTDNSFHSQHPELNGRKFKDNETDLMIQWGELRKCKVLVDHLFYRNHPELNRRKIRSHETNLTNEWKRIRAGLEGCQ